jgi:hypothetical protein
MLFIDQPTQVGLSYDELVNATLNTLGEKIVSPPQYVFPAFANPNGTFPTGRQYSTQNTSMIAASASWHFLQGFLSAFPQYNPGTDPSRTGTEASGINLFAESYGGIYGPVFADYFDGQNEKRLTGAIPYNSTLDIRVASLGIVNGMVDEEIQAPWWPKFAYDNSYGIRLIDQTTELNLLSAFNDVSGCRELIQTCRASAAANDPFGEGDEVATNAVCAFAAIQCNDILEAVLLSGTSPYDIRSKRSHRAMPQGYMEYLNTAAVQKSIGTPLNYTMANRGVQRSFLKSKFLLWFPDDC